MLLFEKSANALLDSAEAAAVLLGGSLHVNGVAPRSVLTISLRSLQTDFLG
jgi:hypothetical protein